MGFRLMGFAATGQSAGRIERVVLVLTVGARSVQGAITAGIAFMLIPEVLDGLGLSPAYQFILFGLGAITYAKHPEGAIEANTVSSLQFVQGLIDRRRQRGANPVDAGDADVATSAGAPVGTPQ